MARPDERRPSAAQEKKQLKRIHDRLRDLYPLRIEKGQSLDQWHRNLIEATKIRATARGFFDLAISLRRKIEKGEQKRGRSDMDPRPDELLDRLLALEPWEGEDERVFLRWKALLLDALFELSFYRIGEQKGWGASRRPLIQNELQKLHCRILELEKERMAAGDERVEDRYQLQLFLAFELYYQQAVRYIAKGTMSEEVKRKPDEEKGRMDIREDYEVGSHVLKPIRVGAKGLLISVPQYRKRRGLYRPWRHPVIYNKLKRLRGLDDRMIRAIANRSAIAFLRALNERIQEQGHDPLDPLSLSSIPPDLTHRGRIQKDIPRLQGLLIDGRSMSSEGRLLILGVDRNGDLGLISTYPMEGSSDGGVGDALEDLERRGLQASGKEFFIVLFGSFPEWPSLPESFPASWIIR